MLPIERLGRNPRRPKDPQTEDRNWICGGLRLIEDLRAARRRRWPR